MLLTPNKPQKATTNSNLPVIYGSVVSSYADWFINSDNIEQVGYYAFQPSSNISFTPICVHPNVFINGGGTFDDSRLYYHIWEMYADENSDTGITFNNYYCVVNTEEWSMLTTNNFKESDSNIAYDMTIDPTTGNLYAVQWGPYEDNSAEFALVDKASGETTHISKVPVMVCLSADNYGRIFGVGYDGYTYYIDKQNGNLICIGDSGVKDPTYIQGATTDPRTNDIYWAAYSENVSALYKLNTFTGKAEFVANMPGQEEITGLFIEDERIANGPAELQNVNLSYVNGNSVISATIPQNDFNGNNITGPVEVDIYINSIKKESKSGNPGETITFTNTLPEGNHVIVLAPKNDNGYGPKSIYTQWCGTDTPAAPRNVEFSLSGLNASLTWDAPSQGLHGGTIDHENLKYNVVRYPDAVEVAKLISETSFSETLPDGIATYYYTVQAVNDMGEGGTATSNSQFIGTAFTVPYFESFDSQESLQGYTIINSEEGRGWYWWDNKALNFQAMASKFSMNNASDNWLILPSITFDKTCEYKLRFKARVFDTESPERFEVKIGQGATIEAQTKSIISPVNVKNEEWLQYDVPFTVDNDGSWNISFHCISAVNSYYFIVDDIEILQTASQDAPAAVSNLSAKGGQGGKNTATLTFTTPTKTHAGNNLASISSVKFYHNDDNTPCGELTNVEPGKQYSWTHEKADKGFNTYRVAAFTGDTKGIESEVTVFVGYDKPLPVTNAKAVFQNDGNILLSWDAPTKGEQGGDLIAEDVTYKIYTNSGKVLTQGVTETSLTDPSFVGISDQYMIYYQIHAVYGDQESDPTITDFVITGNDYSVPFLESFENGGLENTPWTLSALKGNVSGMWNISDNISNPSATPQDNDGGFAYFNANSAPAGVEARITSPKIDLMNANHPVLSFWVYIPGGNVSEKMAVEIASNNNKSFSKLFDIDLNGDEGWKEFKYEIPRKYCVEGALIAFHGTCSGYGKNIAIDNIKIQENSEIEFDYDIEAVSISGPDCLMPNQEAKFTVRVYNNGKLAIDNYKVSLFVNDQQAISTDGEPLEAGSVIDYTFTLTPEDADLYSEFRFKGAISCEQDQNANNNITEEIAMTVGVAGISNANIDNISVFASQNSIVILNADSLPFEIFTANGVKVHDGKATNRTAISLAPGLYLVTIANHTFKILL